jgi:hypothetical protein
MPTIATAIPMPVAAFMTLSSTGIWKPSPSPLREFRGVDGRRTQLRHGPAGVLALILAALHGAREDFHTVSAHRLADALRRLGDNDLGARSERYHRVGVTLDGDDQIWIQMEELELVPESMQGDHFFQFLGPLK